MEVIGWYAYCVCGWPIFEMINFKIPGKDLPITSAQTTYCT